VNEEGGNAVELFKKPMSLLVVDDHPPTLQVLERLLTRDGHRVVVASSIAAARSAAAAQPFDAVISDLGLPDGSGVVLMSELRDRYHMHGIVLSGYGMEEDVRRSREAGFSAHLVKPVDISDLRRALRQIAARASANG
jgi:CheY-like chemotaxis protein